ncbi:MAG: membrane protein [Candidatus Cloacimonadota bacterium]|nr:MAG: membrane protein [Candidatus Cloacimonadota bacterium]
MNLIPQPYVNKKHNLFIGLFVFAITLLVYYLTMARSLSFWDAGEYITCSSILGVPHPPGNPFYILLGRFFAIIGLNLPHAMVVNFLSGLLSAFAVMFTYFFTVKFVTMWLKDDTEAYLAYFAGFLAASYTAFSFTFWNNAIEAEVYSGLAFTINLVIWLTMIWVERSKNFSHQNILLLIIYIFFLGFGIHQTSLQIAPAVLLIAVYPMLKDTARTSAFWKKTGLAAVGLIVLYFIFQPIGKASQIPDLHKYVIFLAFIALLVFHLKEHVSAKTWLLALFLVFVGLSTHFFLFIRSAHRPFINEGYPHTIKLFTDYVLRRQYGVTSMFVRRVDESGALGYNLLQKLWYQFDYHFLRYFSWQFFNAETVSKWMKVPQINIQFFSNIIVTFLGFGGAYYQFKKNKHSFIYFSSFMFFASIAMVIVMNLSDGEVRDRDYFFATAYNFWTFWMAVGSIGLIDYLRKRNKAATIVVAALLLLLPIINFASQYFIHDRSREYIALDYGQNILNSVEENAIIFTNGDNDTFPVWYAQAVYDPAAIEYIPPSNEGQPTDVEEIIYDTSTNPTEVTRKNIERAMKFKNDQCFGIRKDVTIANLSLLNTPWYIHQLIDHEGVEFNIPSSHIDQCQDNPNSVLYPKQVPKDSSLKIKGVKPGDEFTVTFKKGAVLYVKDLAVIQIIKDNYGKRPIYFAVTTPDAIGFEGHLQNEGMVDRLVPTKGANQFNMERLVANIDSVYSYRGIMDDTIYKDTNMRRLLNNYGAAFMRTSQFAHSQRDYANAIKYMEKAIDFIENKARFYVGLSKLYTEAGYFLLENDLIDEGFAHLENAIYYNRTDEELPGAIFQAAIYSEAYEKGRDLLQKMKPYQDSVMIQSYIDRLVRSKTE